LGRLAIAIESVTLLHPHDVGAQIILGEIAAHNVVFQTGGTVWAECPPAWDAGRLEAVAWLISRKAGRAARIMIDGKPRTVSA